MASGKHRRRKQKRTRPLDASSGDVLEQVRQLLARRDGRGALDRLKQVSHGDGRPPEELPLLRFCASIERARGLARSGLDKEAADMRAQAARHRASVSAAALAGEDLALYLRYLEGADALAAYADYLKVQPPAPAAERALADLLVIQRCWDGLDGFEQSHPLRRDAEPVRESLDAMDGGDWDRAAERLQSVPRRSPFAPWRVFCKAMKCFGAGDDAGLRQSLDLLPADFVLAGTVAEWRRVCSGDGAGGPVPVRQALGTEGTAVEALGDELSRALRHNERVRTVERLVIALADALCPEEPLQARIDLLQIAGLAALDDKFSRKSLPGLVRRLLPAERSAGVAARIDLLLQQVLPDRWDPAPAAALLHRLDAEFPRAADRTLARGRVLEALARTGHRAIRPEFLPPRMLKTLSALLDGRFDRPELLFAELMAASLEADPHSREGYHFLLDLLRGQTELKPRLRTTLEAMAARFPDDPAPWLELAALDYSMNAYRRAEHALAEARRRAPHDEGTLDMQAIGFLKSADQSRKSGRFELAAKDLLRAGELRRPKLESILQVKRILLDVVSAETPNAAETVVPHLAGLSPAAQMRTLAVLLHDLGENRNVKNVHPVMASDVRALLAVRFAALDELDPDQRVDLLAPLPADLHVLYNRRHVAPVLADWWPAILGRQEGDGLVAVFDLLMDCGGSAAVRAEIGRRLRGLKKADRDPLLLLYLAVIRYQAGDDHDSRRFTEALDAAPPSDRERLRAVSARLARFAQGILREALQKFDFTILDVPPLFGDGVPSIAEVLGAILGDDEDELEALFGGQAEEPAAEEPAAGQPEDGPLIEKIMDGLRDELAEASPDRGGPRQKSLFDDGATAGLRALEAIIDRHGLRSVSTSVLRDVAEIARRDMEIRRNLDSAARQYEAADRRPGMTREARILLYPDPQGSGRQGMAEE